MTDTHTHPVDTVDELTRTVNDYRRHGYTVVDADAESTTLEYHDRGSLLAHLALFFTVGFWTLGVANWLYARHRKRKTHDRVRVEVNRPPVESNPGP